MNYTRLGVAAAAAFLLLPCAPPAVASGWGAIGPATQTHGYDFLSQSENVSGRVSALAWAPDIDGAGTSALLAGAAGGGVWRSTDYGSDTPTWTPTTDNLGLDPYTESGAIDVGCIAVDTGRHPNVIYVGTGEANFSGDSRYGAGILKSVDGGAHWALLGGSTFGKRSVSRIIVDPTDASGRTLYASMVYAAGGLGGGYGVYKSTDGGTTWNQANGSMGSFAVVTDLEYTLSPTGGIVLFAAVGWPGGSAGNGIYRSMDHAATWTALSGGAPTGSTIGRIALVASHEPGAAPPVYAMAAAPDGSAQGFYRSTNNGDTWSYSYPSGFPGFQGWYDLALGLAGDGTVYLAGVSHPFNFAEGVLESTDGGASWTAVDVGTNGVSPHTDFHAWVTVGPVLYAGNDGGVWRYIPAAPHTQPFSAPRHSNVGGYPSSVAAGRIDADGFLDVAVSSYYDNKVYVLPGRNDGTFGPPADYSVGTHPNQVALGNLNGDASMDMATADYDSRSVSVLLATGPGVFGSATAYTVGAHPGGIAIGDLDRNGSEDIATCNGDGTVSALLNNGSGAFAAAVDTSVPPGTYYAIGIADFDGDGSADIVVANFDSGEALVLAGDGTGHFPSQQTFPTGSKPIAVAVGDLNGDNRPDFVVANYGSSTVTVRLNTTLRGAAISFGPAIDLPLGSVPVAVAIGNFDRDAYNDIATANEDNTVSVIMTAGPNLFSPAAGYPTGPGPTGVAVGDFDGDSAPDICVSAWQGCVSVNLNKAAVVKGQGAWVDLNTVGLATIQMQGMAMHPTDTSVYVEGSQDNGTARRDATTGPAWTTVFGGDGGMARFDPKDGTYCYKVGPQGSLGTDFFQLSTDGGLTWNARTNTIANDRTFPGYDEDATRQLVYDHATQEAKTFPFYPVFAVDPLDGTRVAIGSTYVYETRDRGATWGVIGPQITGTPDVTALAYAPGNDNVIYAGYSNGKVFRTLNDAAPWTDVSAGSPWGGRTISSIAVDPAQPDVAYLSIPSLNTGRVWKTANGGATWTDISGSLPSVPVNALALDGRTQILYAGADLGVWATADSGAHWYRYGASLPNAQVLDLGLNASTNILGAATHGRSAYTISIMPGDVNGDLVVNAADAALALRIAGGLVAASADEALRAGLKPGSPSVTLVDAAAIVRRIYGL